MANTIAILHIPHYSQPSTCIVTTLLPPDEALPIETIAQCSSVF